MRKSLVVAKRKAGRPRIAVQTVSFTCTLDLQVKTGLERFAKERDTSLAVVVREALALYVKEYSVKIPESDAIQLDLFDGE